MQDHTQTAASATDNGAPSTENTNPDERVIELDTPLVRGETTIERITVRKPSAGALRGLSLMALSTLDVASLQTLLPRISQPMLTPQEVARLDPPDLMALGMAVNVFFMTKAEKARYQIV